MCVGAALRCACLALLLETTGSLARAKQMTGLVQPDDDSTLELSSGESVAPRRRRHQADVSPQSSELALSRFWNDIIRMSLKGAHDSGVVTANAVMTANSELRLGRQTREDWDGPAAKSRCPCGRWNQMSS